MKRKDLRNQIIPTKLKNIDNHQMSESEEFDTIDLIYLDTFSEQYEREWNKGNNLRISATDYAIMNNAHIDKKLKTILGKSATCEWTRFALRSFLIIYIDAGEGYWPIKTTEQYIGLRPCLHYKLPSENEETPDIEEVKDRDGNKLYHILHIGEYAKTNLDEQISHDLERLYNCGKIKDEMKVTGRWYSSNGQKFKYVNFAGKHSPEFEYKGDRYVRVISSPRDQNIEYFNGTETGKIGTVRWVKVEPISFIIRNWDDLPISINPKGNGSAEYFDLMSEEVIIANIPYYPDSRVKNCDMWQNSMPRGFLNGIDVRNIAANGNPDFGAARGGNFTGECNFLNEAFNLIREPIHEYTIPDSETEIPDDAFNGCVSLKKLVIHSGITSIGKRAFDGLNFKYAYRLKTGELILGEELPEKQIEYESLIELGAFSEFDYNILLHSDELGEVIELSKKLNKIKFCIPYVFAKQLIDGEMVDSFFENSDFRFFKN